MGATAAIYMAASLGIRNRGPGRPKKNSDSLKRKRRWPQHLMEVENGIGILLPGRVYRPKRGRPKGTVKWTQDDINLVIAAYEEGKTKLLELGRSHPGKRACLRAYMEQDLRTNQYPKYFPLGYSVGRATALIEKNLPRLEKVIEKHLKK